MKVLLLAGGDSSERSVSLESGKAVCEALGRLGHDVYAVDPVTGKSLLGTDGSFLSPPADASAPVPSGSESTCLSIADAVGSAGFREVDLVFVTLHGGSGENGKIQCLLELSGKKYVGSGMAASAIAMNKVIAKRLCAAENILTPGWALYRTHGHVDDRLVEEIHERFTVPMIVKPNDSGSTIGLSKVHSDSELRPALAAALKESTEILVEKFIPGREITAAVLDGRPLPLVEIQPKNELYDFEAKYTKGKSEYSVPADIDESATRGIQKAAARMYDVIGASGLARVDFILDEKNDFYFLELNTLPGMTELSLAPMAASADGIGFDQLIDMLIRSALDRQAT